MKAETFESVWDALAESEQEAADLKARSSLLYEIRKVVAGWDLPAEEAAGRLGVTESQLDDLFLGKLTKFSLEALNDMVVAARLSLEIKAKGAA